MKKLAVYIVLISVAIGILYGCDTDKDQSKVGVSTEVIINGQSTETEPALQEESNQTNTIEEQLVGEIHPLERLPHGANSVGVARTKTFCEPASRSART